VQDGIDSGTDSAVALGPQFMLGCGWYAPLLTRSVNTRLGLCGA
jgi:hypothetical protein